jgi:hypothetical protein
MPTVRPRPVDLDGCVEPYTPQVSRLAIQWIRFTVAGQRRSCTGFPCGERYLERSHA